MLSLVLNLERLSEAQRAAILRLHDLLGEEGLLRLLLAQAEVTTTLLERLTLHARAAQNAFNDFSQPATTAMSAIAMSPAFVHNVAPPPSPDEPTQESQHDILHVARWFDQDA